MCKCRGKETAGSSGRTADPSPSVGMTRGEEWPRLMLLWTERRADPSSTLRSVEKTCYPQRALGGAGVGSFIRVVSSERFERAGGRIADPSLSVGMTRGEEWPKLMLLVDGRRADPSSTLRSLRFHFVWSEGHESSVRDDSSVVPIRNRTAISTGVEGSGCFCRLT